jgi:hypothetical protein
VIDYECISENKIYKNCKKILAKKE